MNVGRGRIDAEFYAQGAIFAELGAEVIGAENFFTAAAKYIEGVGGGLHR
jgi:hypothetical protein